MAQASPQPSWLDSLLSAPQDLQEALVRSLDPEQLQQLLESLPPWRPLPGPQTLALQSEADILFFGGAAGGGKTDFILGLASTQHRRSIIFRREYPQLKGVIDRSLELFPRPANSFNKSDMVWQLADSRQIELGAVQHEGDQDRFQGRAHDLKAFDELPHFSEAQFRFLCGWNRSSDPAQRCRVVGAGNPPTDSDGEWVTVFFAAWLDENHPRPARPGELRWYAMLDGKDVEVDGPTPFLHKGELIRPQSRTFIPAKLADNPYLEATGYRARLQALPEPLRSKMLFGDFKAGREDNAYQVIPSEWVRLAQERWKTRPRPSTPQSALGVDVARGGRDKTIISPRYDNWFDELRAHPGKSTPDGPHVAGLVLLERKDQAKVNIDVIGVGSSPYDYLREKIGTAAVAMNGAEASEQRDKSDQLGFVNQRAEWWWGMREGLDPAGGQDLALPPDPELKADLCAPRWKLTARGIQIESKDDIIKRIGRSPDRGDAVVNAHAIKHFAGEGLFTFMKEEAEKAKLKLEHEQGKHPMAVAGCLLCRPPERVQTSP